MDELMCRMPTAGGNNAEDRQLPLMVKHVPLLGRECMKMGTNNGIITIIAGVMDVVPFQSVSTVLGCH